MLTPREAARMIGISYPTIKQWILSGKLKTVQTPGGHHRIAQSTLKPFLDKDKAKPAAASRERYRRVSGRNQLAGKVISVQIEGLLAEVKHTHLAENIDLEFHAELFDITNAPAFAQPNGSFGSAAFGSITATTTDPRVVQFALRRAGSQFPNSLGTGHNWVVRRGLEAASSTDGTSVGEGPAWSDECRPWICRAVPVSSSAYFARRRTRKKADTSLLACPCGACIRRSSALDCRSTRKGS